MSKLELDHIIGYLNDKSSTHDAYFGFTYEDDCPHIQANEDGLKLFSRQLLKAIRLFEDRKNSENPTISIEGGDWLIGEDFYSYIEPVYVSRKEYLKKENKSSTKDYVYNTIGLTIFGLIIISIIVGFGTMISWIF
ncbi:hypothetical protein [uncultured Winogradskyella sp.]|uniref:hypothetical protein n=1 Tax=uncultured Winogradskyella sp. TaxID=395353 RepID=UPI002619D262|nr:hypothetical protein [uncultured Winogradskyella sp.]